jgi:hypothetical protein
MPVNRYQLYGKMGLCQGKLKSTGMDPQAILRGTAQCYENLHIVIAGYYPTKLNAILHMLSAVFGPKGKQIGTCIRCDDGDLMMVSASGTCSVWLARDVV